MSTWNSPASSKIFRSTGGAAFQVWLFCPSIIGAWMCGAAKACEIKAESTKQRAIFIVRYRAATSRSGSCQGPRPGLYRNGNFRAQRGVSIYARHLCKA